MLRIRHHALPCFCLLLLNLIQLSSAAPDPTQGAESPSMHASAVRELRAAFAQRLSELNLRYQSAADAEQKANLQREISDLKFGLEIDLLELQLRVLQADPAAAAAKAAASEELGVALAALRKLREELGPVTRSPETPATKDR